MKTYPFEFEGDTLTLRKLDQTIKEDVLDYINAGRLKAVQRMFKKKLLSAEDYLVAKQAAMIKWGGEAWVTEIADEENAKFFLRRLLVESVDDETLALLVLEQQDPESSLGLTIKEMVEESAPKAEAPPSMV